MSLIDHQSVKEAEALAAKALATPRSRLESTHLVVVHSWSDDDSGCVLVVAKSKRCGWWLIDAKRDPRGKWVITGSGGNLFLDSEFAASSTAPIPGLRSLGGGSSDAYRSTVGEASEDVHTIRLQSAEATRDLPVSKTGYFLLVIRPTDPITYAVALDRNGKRIPSDPLVL